ncbi:hypothetical protein ACFL0O_11595 [Thermodesulfobacteriota bacterium]
MKKFCDQITVGMQLDDVYKLVEQTHYRYKERKEGDKHLITIIDTRAMGRFICQVTLIQDKVIEARYVYND